MIDPNNTDWTCDKCFSVMNVKKESRNCYLISCPQCGTEWYVDSNSEYINDAVVDDSDDDFELADFCHGGDLKED